MSLKKLNWPIILEIFGLIFLFVVSFYLRFPDLGYSDYIGDEHKSFIRLGENETLWDFFMSQRKGPMQFFVSYIPYLFVGDFRNEFAQRLPFTIFGLLSIFVFYFLIRKLTKSVGVALVASLLLSVNGFIIGFARISQYQNLNLFFSFLSLYFYSAFLNSAQQKQEILRNTLLGTLMFILSLLSHWDAVFILVPILYFLFIFLSNKEIEISYKKKILIYNFVFGCILLLPYLIPYVLSFANDNGNQAYFVRRVTPGVFEFDGYIELIRLYNPFLMLEVLLGFGILGLFFIKKNWMYLIWFLVNYAVFQFLVTKPGTHIYNFIIPFIVFASIGLVGVVKKLPHIFKVIPLTAFVLSFSFFVYQAYVIYIDNKVEYPWNREQLLAFVCEGKNPKTVLVDFQPYFSATCGNLLAYFKTPVYTEKDHLPLFGFPLSRNWNEINVFINEQNSARNEKFGYITNEAKTIAEKYMDAKYRANNGFYIVAIKKPLSFVDDWTFGKYKKNLVKEFHKDGSAVVKIYRVEPGDTE